MVFVVKLIHCWFAFGAFVAAAAHTPGSRGDRSVKASCAGSDGGASLLTCDDEQEELDSSPTPGSSLLQQKSQRQVPSWWEGFGFGEDTHGHRHQGKVHSHTAYGHSHGGAIPQGYSDSGDFHGEVYASGTLAQPTRSTGTGCHPICTWKCIHSPCEQVCEPDCEAPQCQVRCRKNADFDQCEMDCNEKKCQTFCSHPCEDSTCPWCETKCLDPVCTMKCPHHECKEVCNSPACKWKCQEPTIKANTSCQNPECQLTCNAPACLNPSNYKDFEPLQEGWSIIKSFQAPKATPSSGNKTRAGGETALLQSSGVKDDRTDLWKTQLLQLSGGQHSRKVQTMTVQISRVTQAAQGGKLTLVHDRTIHLPIRHSQLQ